MQIGAHRIQPPVILAPMAGVTDKPFRVLCKQLGAGLCVSEMTISDARFWNTPKSRRRMDHHGEPAPISVQIAGTEPLQLAAAARHNVAQGAELIDINMGCPAKKVCNVWAGSALLRDEPRVAAILTAVVAAVAVPVTLKIRTGWNAHHRNAVSIARIAEDSGIAALAVHGRTREQLYTGQAEYDTIAAVKAAVQIPVIANGDIHSPERAARVLAHTGCDALMIGRAAQGRPWIFREIAHFLATGTRLPPPTLTDVQGWLLGHLDALHAFYGESSGVRIARKHLGWYLHTITDRADHTDAADTLREFRAGLNQIESATQQRDAMAVWFEARIARLGALAAAA